MISLIAALVIAGATPSPDALDDKTLELLKPICETAAQKMVYNDVDERAGHLVRSLRQVLHDYNLELERRMLALDVPDYQKNVFREACREYTAQEAPRIIREYREDYYRRTGNILP